MIKKILNNKLWFIYTFIAMRFIDLLTTNINIQYFGAYEANPAAAYILNHFSWIGLTILIALFCLTAIVSIYIIPSRIWDKLAIPFWLLTALTAIGPIMNFRIIFFKMGITHSV